MQEPGADTEKSAKPPICYPNEQLGASNVPHVDVLRGRGTIDKGFLSVVIVVNRRTSSHGHNINSSAGSTNRPLESELQLIMCSILQIIFPSRLHVIRTNWKTKIEVPNGWEIWSLIETAGIGVFCSIRPSTNYLWHRRIIPHTIKWTIRVGGVFLSLMCNTIRLYLPPPADFLTCDYRVA